MTGTASPSIEQAFQQAVGLHRAGQLQDAERLYRSILHSAPNHAETNHNLGIIAIQARQPAEALPHFTAAIEANPKQGRFRLSHINALIQAGRMDAAREALVRSLHLELDPEAVAALIGVLGNHAGNRSLAQQEASLSAHFAQGRFADARALAETITARFPLHGKGWMALGKACALLKDAAGAVAPCQMAAALLPNDAEAHYNLCLALKDMRRLAEAEASGRRALALKPDFAGAHLNLGRILQSLGRAADADASFRQAIRILPAFAEAHGSLGLSLHQQGRLAEAEASYARALEIAPNSADTHHDLGVCLQAQGRSTEAQASFRRALDLKAEIADAGYHLASQLIAQGDPLTALNVILQSLAIRETEGARRMFVDCARRVRFIQEDAEVRAMVVRALTERWVRPSELAATGVNLVKLNPVIQRCLARLSDAGLRASREPAQALLGAGALAALGTDPLLRLLLISTPLCDIEMERLLTVARRAMLEAARESNAADAGADGAIQFCSALARQCFINEYVFSRSADELRQAEELLESLNAALNTGAALQVLAVATYLPLSSLPLAPRLLEAQWPEDVAAVLVQQIREPEEERRLRESIARLTGIDDEVSQLVRSQYEENPYPRWVNAAPAGNATEITEYLRRKFPLAPLKRGTATDGLDVLIAGCGTGQHAIETSRLFQGARVLALDLSMNSLGYAKRKTLELGITGIEYAQADLLQLGSLGRSFDLIESAGVLHHLADPWEGWRVLLALLRPGGIMRLGFYSALARRHIVKGRAFIAEKGYGATADEIRRCRQDLLGPDTDADLRAVTTLSDFFGTSECRDLLFHVQEHRMTLTEIGAFLRANGLAFVGFEIEDEARQAYRKCFPLDRAATDLHQWQRFENDNPDTFIGMYQFWVQKAG